MNLQFVRTVDRLRQSVAVPQVGGHLEGVDLQVGLLRQGGELPQQHPEGPGVRGRREAAPLQGLARQPLDGAVLVVAQTVVVGGEEVAGERVVGDLNSQFVVHTVI